MNLSPKIFHRNFTFGKSAMKFPGKFQMFQLKFQSKLQLKFRIPSENPYASFFEKHVEVL